MMIKCLLILFLSIQPSLAKEMRADDVVIGIWYRLKDDRIETLIMKTIGGWIMQTAPGRHGGGIIFISDPEFKIIWNLINN